MQSGIAGRGLTKDGGINMRRIWTAPLIFGLTALLVSAGLGCNSNPIILLSYLLNNGDPKMDAEFPLKPRPKHEKEEVKVVVLISCGSAYSPDMIGIDRSTRRRIHPGCSNAVARRTRSWCSVLKSQPIDTYKRENPDWREMHPVDIGKKFGADYVIEIEVLEMSIYEPKSTSNSCADEPRSA